MPITETMLDLTDIAPLAADGNYRRSTDAIADVLDYIDQAAGELAGIAGPAALAALALLAAASLALQ